MQNLLLNHFLVFALYHGSNSKVNVFVDVFFALGALAQIHLVVHISNVCVALEIVSSEFVVAVISETAAVFLDGRFSELDLVLNANLAQAEKHDADTFAKSILEFVGREVQIDAQLAELGENVF